MIMIGYTVPLVETAIPEKGGVWAGERGGRETSLCAISNIKTIERGKRQTKTEEKKMKIQQDSKQIAMIL